MGGTYIRKPRVSGGAVRVTKAAMTRSKYVHKESAASRSAPCSKGERGKG